jgi:type I restriction enzyme S subunit
MRTRLRHFAQINPTTPTFDALPDTAEVTFMPLETVWADGRRDTSRKAAKADVGSGYVRFQDGDVLVPKTAPTFQRGRSTVVRGLANGTGAGSSELHILRARSGADARFLSYVVRSTHFIAEGVAAYQGVAGLQRVTADFVADWPVLERELEEQRRIADFLDDQVALTDRLVEKRNRQAALLRQEFQTRLHYAISGADWKARQALESRWLTSVPEHWRFTRLTYFARLGSGHTPSRNHPEWWLNCTIPWITTGDVSAYRDDMREIITETKEMISLVGMQNSSATIHPAGTVALSRTASAGFSMVMGTDMATSQDYATWTCGPRLDPYWLLWCLRAMRDDLLGRLAMGSTFKTIYMPNLQALQIPVPPLMEQQTAVGNIRSSAAALRERLRLVDRSTQLLQERKQALITAAVTGQLDVTSARSVA